MTEHLKIGAAAEQHALSYLNNVGLITIAQYKREKIITTAEYFLNEYPQWLEHSCRFDVITAHPSNTEVFTLDWIQDAFET